jgi:phosphoribosylamine--glycine ligase
MAVSGGYPGSYQKGFTISGLTEASTIAGTLVFQAGTGFKEDAVVTNGGRVLTTTAQGSTLQNAVTNAQKALAMIHFEGMYFRKDIGYEFKA